MGIVKEKNVSQFLNLKDKDLFNYYRKAPKDIQKIMSNVYNCCFRFNLNNSQTLYMLNEVIKPLRVDILSGIFNN